MVQCGVAMAAVEKIRDDLVNGLGAGAGTESASVEINANHLSSSIAPGGPFEDDGTSSQAC
jgi:hypothetical protein